jgi:hypothetical protein
VSHLAGHSGLRASTAVGDRSGGGCLQHARIGRAWKGEVHAPPQETRTGNIGSQAIVAACVVLASAEAYVHVNGVNGAGMHRIARGADERYTVDLRPSVCVFHNPHNVHDAAMRVARAALEEAVPRNHHMYEVHSLGLLHSPAGSARQARTHIDFARTQMGTCYTVIVTLNRGGVLHIVDDAKVEKRLVLRDIGDLVCFHKWREHAGAGYRDGHWRLSFYAAPKGVVLEAYGTFPRVVRQHAAT